MMRVQRDLVVFAFGAVLAGWCVVAASAPPASGEPRWWKGNLRAVREQAERAGREIVTHLNHPNFEYAVTPHDLAHAVLERHFEVFNGHPHVNQRGDATRPGVDRLWDIANTVRPVDRAAPAPASTPDP